MTCHRCHGLMVLEEICDFHEIGEALCFDGYRCLQCGEIVDAVILDNRRRIAVPAGETARKKPRLPRLVSA